jgi:MYXO-CTERM domain-containing protein
VSCQSKGYAQCKTDLTGGCKAQCQKPEGALFCDGNYVDSGNNLQNCIDALNAVLHVKVDASASCSGNTCTAQASASSSCAATPHDDASPLNAGLLIGVLGIAAIGARRRFTTARGR